ncbi:glycoside hydrolase family 15 protein [Actinacidiphila glaucinigra]|uniref:glycoside hydrolase family 15 protein n=1 Tax=Actinacidiphila glaucinigra TaxID=235986 RepID=UPI003AF39622
MTSPHVSQHDMPPPHVLREYALIADGERGALIGPRGDIVWLCVPRWDSSALFSSLIGGSGHYTVSPRGRFVWGGFYEEGTLIWCNRWITESGIVECREALAFPGDPRRAVLLRRITAIEGAADLTVHLEPYADFGYSAPREVRQDEDQVWNGRSGKLRWRWTGATTARPRDNARHATGLTMDLRLSPGNCHDLVLELSEEQLAEKPEASHAWNATVSAWRREVPTLENNLAPGDSRHAYTVLRGLTSSTGGMVGAATTSLPERAEAGRNYDYRYVWLRDQCYAGQAVAASGPHQLLDDAVRFVSARLHQDGPRMSPAYTVAGGPVPNQTRLGLNGYPGGYDRIGNWVNRQFQLDVFGEALGLFAAAHRHGRLDAEGWRAAEIAADAIARRRHEPDAGIWELDNRAWTHSRLEHPSQRPVAALSKGPRPGRRTADAPAARRPAGQRPENTANVARLHPGTYGRLLRLSVPP